MRGGTLLASIATRDGLVICGDRLVGGSGPGPDGEILRIPERDREAAKIHPLGRSVVFGLVGFPWQVRGGRTVFDAEKLTKKYFNRPHVDPKDFPELVDGFKAYLGERFWASTLAGLGVDEYPDPVPREDHVVFELPFWVMEAQRIYSYYSVRLRYEREPEPAVDVGATVHRFDDAAAANVKVFGGCDVCHELAGGTNPDFDGERAHRLAGTLSGTPPRATDVSGEEGAQFLEWIIRLEGEKGPSITGESARVSRSTDCCILDRESRFRWLWRGAPSG